ncbi:hypothetical protein HHI36_001764 [Cryptolaemus montrouzieri]|uniref:Uncharacterized protein n=1 Tax=Cryptolaemus montrouzieri TaxID=559131 RepID=A0ABD2P8W8_9CUCU
MSSQCLQVSPHNPCSCENPIPVDMEKCCHKMKQVWNHTVIIVFEGIANAPDNLVNFIARKWNEFMKKDCKVCRPIKDEEYMTLDECELIDDYDEKYSKETDECDEEELLLLQELAEVEDWKPGPSCGQ